MRGGRRRRLRRLACGTALGVVLPAVALAQTAPAQTAPTDSATVEELVVIARDKVGLIEVTPTDGLLGLDKPLVETPRAATYVSVQTLERYGIEEVDDLTAITPGAFTASYYGVKGAVNLRGTLAEAYFRGFKRIENRGTYATPLGAAGQVRILRGPPAAVSGPGKVGGYLDIEPRTALVNGRLAAEAGGQAELTLGSYGKFNAAAQAVLPFALGPAEAGLSAYVEREDSDSFYRGVHPEHTVAQVALDVLAPGGVRWSAGYARFEERGNVQTPGWNRLTQQLVDDRLYQTGRDTTLVDADGNGRLTPNESGSLVGFYFGFPPTPPASFSLDTGLGLAPIGRRTVFVSAADFNRTDTNTAWLDMAAPLGRDAELKAQLFYDDLSNARFVSYGFPAAYRASTVEGRLSLVAPFSAGPVDARTLVGVSYRRQKARKRESFNGGYLALDRRDLLAGPTPTDVFDSPFTDEPGGIGLGWDYDNRSLYKDAGLFATLDADLGRLNLILSGRYDRYDVRANDTGPLTFQAVNRASDHDGDLTYSASLSWRAPFGLLPYVTYAESSALEVSQAGDLPPNLIGSGEWLSDSDLVEAGVKFSLLSGDLVGGLSWYRQTRTRLDLLSNVAGTRGRGVELEVRWVATDNLSLTFAGNRQRTTVEGPDASFTYVPPNTVGLTGQQAYGGAFATFNFSTFPSGYPGDYELRSIPEVTASLYGSYVSDAYAWGQAGLTLGGTYVSETSGSLQNPVVYPDYVLVNASAFVTLGATQLQLNVDNLFDRTYFQPLADIYANLAVLPGRGREVRVTLKQSF